MTVVSILYKNGYSQMVHYRDDKHDHAVSFGRMMGFNKRHVEGVTVNKKN